LITSNSCRAAFSFSLSCLGIKYFWGFMGYFAPKGNGFIIPPEGQIDNGGSKNNPVEPENTSNELNRNLVAGDIPNYK